MLGYVCAFGFYVDFENHLLMSYGPLNGPQDFGSDDQKHPSIKHTRI